MRGRCPDCAVSLACASCVKWRCDFAYWCCRLWHTAFLPVAYGVSAFGVLCFCLWGLMFLSLWSSAGFAAGWGGRFVLAA